MQALTRWCWLAVSLLLALAPTAAAVDCGCPGPCTEGGTCDMRYKENKEYRKYCTCPARCNNDGSCDMRYSANKRGSRGL